MESILVREIKTDVKHNLIAENKNADPASDGNGFDALSDDDKAKVEKVLFLLDKFCVGDSFYHEMTVVVDGLLRSYFVKQRLDQLHKICHVRDYITTHPNVISDGETLAIKISGDGAKMTRSSNYILMSFAILQSSDDIMAAKGNHTIAVVKGKEDYDLMRGCYGNIKPI